MSHKFLAGAGLLVLAGWGVSGLAVAGSDIKQVDLTLRILVDGPPPCSVKGSAVEFGNVVINRIDGTNYQQDAKYTLNCGNKVSDDLPDAAQRQYLRDQRRNGSQHGYRRPGGADRKRRRQLPVCSW